MSARQRGFTLLEIMISLFILLVGLLGIANLILKGQRASYEAYQRQQALAMAQEMVEYIRANQAAAPYYKTGATEGTTLPGRGGRTTIACASTGDCTPSQLAQNDLARWDQQLFGTREKLGTANVGGIINARGCVEWDSGLDNPVFSVSVSWQGESETAAPTTLDTAASTCGKDLYGTETRRRLVTLKISTCRLLSATTGGCAP